MSTRYHLIDEGLKRLVVWYHNPNCNFARWDATVKEFIFKAHDAHFDELKKMVEDMPE